MAGGTPGAAAMLWLASPIVLLALSGSTCAASLWPPYPLGRRLQQRMARAPQQEPAGAVADGVAQCPAFSPVNASWVPASSIFDQLSAQEVAAVEEYLTTNTSLSLHDHGKGTLAMPMDNFLYRIELFPPPKGEAVSFLDGQGPRPLRFARAIVYRGAENPRDMMEYKVGPLPLDPSTATVEQLRRPGEIPFYRFPPSPTTERWADMAIGQTAFELRALFRSMTGGKCYISRSMAAEHITTASSGQPIAWLASSGHGFKRAVSSVEGCTAVDIQWVQYPDNQNTSESRIALLRWQFVPNRQGGDETFLHPLPLSWKLDETDPNITRWHHFDFEYCHQGPFDSAQELLDAFQAGQLKSCSAPEYGQPGYNSSWARTNNPASTPQPTAAPGPRQYSPGGPRFSVSSDKGTGRRFRWLGWEGHASISPGTGIVFHDITYKGKRIIYELAQQDMFVDYSGYGGAGQVADFDSAYDLGLTSHALVRGVDCPWEAHYMDTLVPYSTTLLRRRDSMCLFEEDMATTAWRHTHTGDSAGPHADSARAVELVFRTISTLGNYDYIVDIRFRQDASIEVRLTAAGYMSTLFHDPAGNTVRDRPFGTRVQKYVLANIHDHLSGWKVDLDIEGRNNTFHITEVKVGTYQEALANLVANASHPGWWTNLPLKYLHRSVPPTEAGYKLDMSRPQGFHIVNDNSTNRWGAARGYAIVHGATTAQLLPDTHPVTKAAAWTKYHVAVTQHHDNESRSHASIYDFYNPGSPIGSLDNYFNGKPVSNTDLVVWVTMGLQHVPRSEDIPLIYNLYASFLIKPWNYFDRQEALYAGTFDGVKNQGCMPPARGEAAYHWII